MDFAQIQRSYEEAVLVEQDTFTDTGLDYDLIADAACVGYLLH